MKKRERRELERARQLHIRRYNEERAEEARWELSRVSCGNGCDPCSSPDCPHAKEVDPEIPQ